MTAPTSGRDDATLRGAVVLVVAIVIGLALLVRSGGGGDDDAAATTSTTSTTEFEGSTVDTAAPINDSSSSSVPDDSSGAREPSEVTVLVLNSTRIADIAGNNTETLIQAGYTTLEPANATTGELAMTTVYATSDAQADAEVIRSLLGFTEAELAEMPEQSLGGASADADVVVVLGLDAG